MTKNMQSVVRGGRCLALVIAAGAAVMARADSLYWTGGNGAWAGTNWATTSGGAASVAWADGDDAVIETANPTVTVAASSTFNVGTLTIENGLTLVQGGSAAVLNINTGGSGNLTLGATATQLQVRLNGTSAWNGTITLNGSSANNNNYLYVTPASAVDTGTKLKVDAGRVLFNRGSAYTIGELAGSANGLVGASGSSGNATLTIDQAGDTVFAGTIGSSTDTALYALSLVKKGAGTLVLSGAVTHRGTTTIEAGKLYFNGASAGGNAINGVTVSGGATLGGKGLVGIGGGATRNVTIANGGILAPGDVDAIGTLTINGNTGTAGAAVTSAGLIFQGAARIDVRLGALGTNDKISLTGGGVNFGKGSASGGAGSILFDFTNYNGEAQLGTYDLITFANTPGIAATAFGLTADSIAKGWAGTFAYDGNILQFTVTGLGAIPEPSTCAALAGLTVLGLTCLRRRRGGSRQD